MKISEANSARTDAGAGSGWMRGADSPVASSFDLRQATAVGMVCVAVCVLWGGALAHAHDTWVEANTNLVRSGEAVYVDLMLGNHGNQHRDFRLASKIDLEGTSLAVVGPDGKSFDLKDRLADLGYAPKEGFWRGRYVTSAAGLYVAVHTLDRVVNHGKPIRAIKGAKTFFVASKTLDRVSDNNPGFDRVFGHPLELVPVTSPVTPMGPGQAISVRVLFKGKPLAGARVSFIPRGVELAEGFDQQHERTTGSDGQAEFTPRAGNQYLVVVHHRGDDESGTASDGEAYDMTAYSATLTVFVPETCPCCGD